MLWNLFSIAQIPTLPRYTCLAKQADVHKWLNQFDRALDHEGVVTEKNQRDPLAIAMFGILNYEEFLAERDSVSERHIRNQYRFFCNKWNIKYIANGLGMGLPYRVKHGDMVPPWYSGMTQGVAISYLLRYYVVTKNPAALMKARQVAYFMLRPLHEGGSIGQTPEGHTWIEEYPNSKKNPQVLNGFINGLIGLYEYCQFFPLDTHARRIHDECYEALLLTLPTYNTPKWTNYDRKNHPVNNSYMRYQIGQMEHLYEIYQNEHFLNQMILWAALAYGKQDYQLKFYQYPHYQYSWKLNAGDMDAGLTTTLDFDLSISSVNGLRRCRTITEAVPMGLPYRISSSRPLYIQLPHPCHFLRLVLAEPFVNSRMEIMAWDAEGKNVQVDFRNQHEKVDVQSLHPFVYLGLKPILGDSDGQPVMMDILSQDPDQQLLPRFLYDTLGTYFPLKKGHAYAVHCSSSNIAGLKLFYRMAPTKALVKDRIWRNNYVIHNPSQPFIAPESGEYQFLLSFPFVLPHPVLSGFQLAELP